MDDVDYSPALNSHTHLFKFNVKEIINKVSISFRQKENNEEEARNTTLLELLKKKATNHINNPFNEAQLHKTSEFLIDQGQPPISHRVTFDHAKNNLFEFYNFNEDTISLINNLMKDYYPMENQMGNQIEIIPIVHTIEVHFVITPVEKAIKQEKLDYQRICSIIQYCIYEKETGDIAWDCKFNNDLKQAIIQFSMGKNCLDEELNIENVLQKSYKPLMKEYIDFKVFVADISKGSDTNQNPNKLYEHLSNHEIGLAEIFLMDQGIPYTAYQHNFSKRFYEYDG
ncbi:hypothetical protein [Desulfobacula phenolica]|uniref:Uncharacterized protein n=1 Tax=Desulfobacula phenolica TaxID=90732 RepID=A0A1H2ID74_9BACT|nr:hypothetical protein [Desulfobacula phenolica]SDU41955.1 hypothetical protein SAMN04487931_10890 [Desulfobacula phenolica]